MRDLPQIIQAYSQYSNPYQVSHAHGFKLNQSGKTRESEKHNWKKISSELVVSYPLISFEQKLKGFPLSVMWGFENKEGFLKTKSWGLNKEAIEGEEVSRNALCYYLSLLPIMPWALSSEHVQMRNIDEHAVEVSLSSYPEVKGVFLFTEEGKINSFQATAFRKSKDGWQEHNWQCQYNKYNIKKSYKMPTDLKYSWVNEEETETYLHLEKFEAFSVL